MSTTHPGIGTDPAAIAAHVDREQALRIVRSTRRRHYPRTLLVTMLLLAAAILTAMIAISVGSLHIPLLEVPADLLGQGPREHVYVVSTLRLPRVATGLLVGLALGISGAIFQSLVDNELASPDIIGITSGASLGAVFMIVIGASAAALSLGALAGGVFTAALVYLISNRNGVSGYRLILVGIGMSATVSAGTSYLMLKATNQSLLRANVWLTGSLTGQDWSQTRPLAISLIILLPLALALSRPLRILQLGDDTAKGIGVHVNLAKAGILTVGVALAAFATATCGPITFVAFVSPPIVRRLLRNGTPALLASGLFGALLVTIADLIARLSVGNLELPVGVVTGILGAPYLVWLLIQTNRTSTGD